MALRDQPYIPLYVQDFLTDEKLNECSAESVGVYIMLMCVMHKSKDYGTFLLRQKDRQNESKVSDFAAKLTRHLPFDVATIKRALTELLDEGVLNIDGDMLFQKRMVKDGKLSEKRSAAGRKGAKSTNAKSFAVSFAAADQSANPSANSENEIESENEYENDIESEGDTEKDTTTRARANILYFQDERFTEFWKAYPKKIGKQAAKKAFSRVKIPVETLLTAIERQKRSDQWSRDNGRYIPNPATWLNQERWEDELTKKGGGGVYGADWERDGEFKPSMGFRKKDD